MKMPASDDLPSYQFTNVRQRVIPEQRANVSYELILRQQPKQSRMCGVGEKADRRPIDPPPIVQLIVKTPPSHGSSKINNGFTSYLQNPYYFMHASLVEKDTREDVLLIKDTRSKEEVHLFKDNRTKATTGSSVSSLYPLKDFEDNGTESGFFVFPDLSVRMEGVYRLKFCLYEMVGSDVHFCAHVISEPLIVYSAKKFPGMEESTLLSQYFAEQGLKIRIRKEVRPKKRSRGEYITAPTSASPTGSQHFDHADPFESQNEDETTTTVAAQSTSVDTPTTSKRRASGTRAMDSRRVEASPAQHVDIAGHVSHRERRPSHTLRSASWRGPTTDHTEHQTIINASDRPRSAHESNPRQQDYFDDAAAAARRSSAANRAAEGVSHLDLNAGPRGPSSRRHDQRMEEYRPRTQDHVPAGHERGLTATSPSSRQGPPASHFRASIGTRHTPIQSHLGEGRLQGQYASHSPTMLPIHYSSEMLKDSASRLKSGAIQEYTDESMRTNSVGQHRELAQETPHVYDARGGSNVPVQRHPRDPPRSPPYLSEQPSRVSYPHPQSFTAGSRPPELTFHHSSRQSMSNAADQMSMDYSPAVSHSGESHKPSVPNNPHELSDYRMRPGAASTLASPFHPLSQTLQQQQQQQVQHEQQYQDRPGQGQIQDSTGPRRPSHHDSYAGHRQSFAPQPYTSPPGKYLAQGGQGPLPQYTIHSLSSSHASHIADQASYSPQDGSVVAHGRYIAHGHPSYPGVQAESIGRPSREDQAPVRPQDYHALPASRFPHVSPLPVPMSNVSSVHPSTDISPPAGYPAHSRERQSPRGSVGFSVSAAAATAPGVSYPIVISNDEHPTSMAPSSYPLSTLSQDPSLGMMQRTGPRPGSTEQSPQDRLEYRHSRSYSSSSAPRPPYQPPSLSTSAAAMAPSQASNYGATLAVSKRMSYPHGGENVPGPYEGYEDGHGHQYATTHPVLRNAQDHALYENPGGRSYEQEPGYVSAQGPLLTLAQQQPHQHQHQHHHQMQQQQLLQQYPMRGAPLHPHHPHQHVSQHPPPHQHPTPLQHPHQQHPYQHHPRPLMQQHQHQHHPPPHSSTSQQYTIHAEQAHHSSLQHSLAQHHTHPYPPPH